MTRGGIKTNIRTNLADANVTFYTDDDLNDSLQDAYDDIACLTQCFTKTVTLSWIDRLSYYNFKALGVPDYLNTIAIFNNVNNQWLRDDLGLRDFDRLRLDWENWIGTPQFWAPSDSTNIAIAAKYIANSTLSLGAFYNGAFSNAFYIGTPASVLGTFNLIYSTVAPQFVDDSSSPLIASDVQNLFEFYTTADMLEQAEEFAKASEYYGKYYETIDDYTARVKKINRADLMLRI